MPVPPASSSLKGSSRYYSPAACKLSTQTADEASALKPQAGIPTTICERDSGDRYKHRQREWGMTLHWGSEALGKVLLPELRQRLHEACCDPFHTPAEKDGFLFSYAGHTGELLFKTPAPNARSVSRSKMRRLFGEGLDIQVGDVLEPTSSGVSLLSLTVPSMAGD